MFKTRVEAPRLNYVVVMVNRKFSGYIDAPFVNKRTYMSALFQLKRKQILALFQRPV